MINSPVKEALHKGLVNIQAYLLADFGVGHASDFVQLRVTLLAAEPRPLLVYGLSVGVRVVLEVHCVAQKRQFGKKPRP